MSGGRNALLAGGLAVAGVGGYYLYSAGGDPKVAQKQIERQSFTPSIPLPVTD